MNIIEAGEEEKLVMSSEEAEMKENGIVKAIEEIKRKRLKEECYSMKIKRNGNKPQLSKSGKQWKYNEKNERKKKRRKKVESEIRSVIMKAANESNENK